MRIKFDYQTVAGTVGHMAVDMEKFLPNTRRTVRKMFKLMLPNLTRSQLEELEIFLEKKSKESAVKAVKFEQYLQMFRGMCL